MSSSGTVPDPDAALFTIASRRPHVSSASRTIWSVPAPVVMSLAFSIASPPASRIMVTVSAAPWRSFTTIRAPRRARSKRVLAPESVVRAGDRHHPVVEAQLVHGRILADRKGAWRRESSTGGW